MKKIAFLTLLTALIFSCNKIEGPGGTSSIQGKLIITDYNGSGELIATYPASDEDVFIIYGKDNTTHSDKATTSYDGSYRFDNLTTGSYKVYAYSKCDTCASGVTETVKEVVISNKKTVVTAPDLISVQ